MFMLWLVVLYGVTYIFSQFSLGALGNDWIAWYRDNALLLSALCKD